MMEFGGEAIRVKFSPIEPGTAKMNGLVEGLAKQEGGKVWDYYMGLSDRGYDRLVREAVRKA